MPLEKVTGWCGFGLVALSVHISLRTTLPVAEAMTINGERYRWMITNFFWPELDDMGTNDMWFEQDGATCHTAYVTLDILHEQFEGVVISRKGDVNWPQRSCDLTPLVLRGANKPQTTAALKANITGVIGQIQCDLRARVEEKWIFQMRATQRSRDGHLHDVILHTYVWMPLLASIGLSNK